MKKTTIFSLAIVILSILIGIVLYPLMPVQMASHWDAYGEVNGYIGKFWGLFLMPVISIILFALFNLIPKIDPLKSNIDLFREEFDRFICVIMTFLFYIYLLTLIWNLGARFDMISLLIPAMAALIYYIGILTGKAKRNWFIGIRTPWTLSDEKIWDKTHELGGKLFRASGILMLSGLVFRNEAVYIALILVSIAAFWPVIYSYVLWLRSK